MTRRLTAWAPAVAVPVIIAAGAIVVPMQASAAVDLPDKTPQQVLAMIGESSVTAFSGSIEQRSDLGLPDLSAATPSGEGAGPEAGMASVLELLTGSHEARVYVDGSARSSVQVMDTLAERKMIRNGSELWVYDSEDKAATHVTLPESPEGAGVKSPAETASPAAIADELLDRLDPTTEISVSDDVAVAGRSAYTLVLTPEHPETLIAAATLAVDADTGLPLKVSLLARGQTAPAFEVAFTALDLSTPPAEVFTFTPPADATVTEEQVPPHEDHVAAPPSATPTVFGSGWGAVIELPSGGPTEIAGSPLLDSATQAVPGGRVLSTSLATVLFTDDGRVLAGAVSAARLLDVAAGR